MNRADVNSFYLYDGLGSVRQLTANNETVVASYTYDSFGNLIASSGSTANPYGFTGEQQFNEADDLVFLRARYYNPSIGRFISRDPIGYEGGINLYIYCINNPVINVDPTGEGIIVPDDGSKTPWECPKVDGFYRHCASACRLRKVLGPGPAPSPLSDIATLIAALYAGRDFPWDPSCPSTTSDRTADLVGIALGGSPVPFGMCNPVCKSLSKAISRMVCK